MKTKIIFISKIVLVICLLALTIFFFYKWPLMSLFTLFLLVQIKEHWDIALMFLVTTIVSSVGGAILLWSIHFIFTGEFFIEPQSMWSFGWLLSMIYVLGLVIEEDQRKPYIRLWLCIKSLYTSVNKLLFN